MSIDKEAEVRGMYQQLGTWYGYPYTPVQRLNPPIPAGENLRRYMMGEDYEWVPDVCADLIDVTPECIPDVVACGFGGGLDAFGVKWIPDTNAEDLPSFVEPGFTVLHDITKWREELRFPDVDSWDWAACGKKYREFYADDDRMLRGIILSGFFERLISLMGFQNAALSLIMEPEEVAALFDALADVNCKIIDHYVDDFGCGQVMLHDDWSAQRAPFFSLDTAMDLLVAPMKKVIDHAHERGIIFTHHSCGNAVDLIPAMIAEGADAWQGQVDSFDLDDALAAAGDNLVLEIYPLAPDDIAIGEVDEFVRKELAPAFARRFLCEIYDYDPDRCFETRRAAYRVGREMAIQAKAAIK